MRIRSIFGKFAAVVWVAIVAASVAQAQQEILIGYHGPLTGPASWVGLGGRDGALLALDEINAVGGINGRKIRMISYDDAGKPSEAEAVAKKMIESDKVFAILGGGISNVAIVVGDEAHRAKVPYMNSTAGSPKVMDAQSRWVFTGATIDGRDNAQNYDEQVFRQRNSEVVGAALEEVSLPGFVKATDAQNGAGQVGPQAFVQDGAWGRW